MKILLLDLSKKYPQDFINNEKDYIGSFLEENNQEVLFGVNTESLKEQVDFFNKNGNPTTRNKEVIIVDVNQQEIPIAFVNELLIEDNKLYADISPQCDDDMWIKVLERKHIFNISMNMKYDYNNNEILCRSILGVVLQYVFEQEEIKVDSKVMLVRKKQITHVLVDEVKEKDGEKYYRTGDYWFDSSGKQTNGYECKLKRINGTSF